MPATSSPEGITLVKVTVEGLTPMMMNRFTEESAASTRSRVRKVGKCTEEIPREEAKHEAYMDPETEELYVPTTWLMAAFTEAGKFFKIKNSKLTTAKSSIVGGYIWIEEEPAIPLGTTHFEVDSRRVVIPATGGAVVRHRPRLDKWGFEFTLGIDEDGTFDLQLARDIVETAGKRVGVGEYRPQRRGTYGKFRVTSWEVLGETGDE